jgi:PTH1 family peptidyl-tRNA hydrolase
MKLIVGLGNPGRTYQGTRHNVGYDVVDQLAEKYASGNSRHNFQADTWEAQLDGVKALLVKPLTFMNRSGASVLAVRDFYKVQTSDLLIVSDDMNLPLGKLRFRSRGSAGGQKGLADILTRLATDEVPRLRIGVGSPPPGQNGADYVLGRFRKEEKSEIEITLVSASEAVAKWATAGIEVCMNQYN